MPGIVAGNMVRGLMGVCHGEQNAGKDSLAYHFNGIKK